MRSMLCALTIGVALAGCATRPAPLPRPAAPLPPIGAEIDAAAAALDAGEVEAARSRLAGALAREPLNPSARLLLDSIDRDPVDLLGPQHFAYTTRPGETMADLAERFLGNRLKAYQLARYNGLPRPAALAPGQTLRIPGTAPRPARPAEADRPKPAPPAKPAADPAAARRAHAAGQAALNRGDVGAALVQLRRAITLDPRNAAAARDLKRAERIDAMVRARR